jgi:hypothetical protein
LGVVVAIVAVSLAIAAVAMHLGGKKFERIEL